MISMAILSITNPQKQSPCTHPVGGGGGNATWNSSPGCFPGTQVGSASFSTFTLPPIIMVQWKMTPLERKQVFGETQTTNFHDYGRKSICTFCMQKMSVYKIYYLFNEHFEYTHLAVHIYLYIYVQNMFIHI